MSTTDLNTESVKFEKKLLTKIIAINLQRMSENEERKESHQNSRCYIKFLISRRIRASTALSAASNYYYRGIISRIFVVFTLQSNARYRLPARERRFNYDEPEWTIGISRNLVSRIGSKVFAGRQPRVGRENYGGRTIPAGCTAARRRNGGSNLISPRTPDCRS